MSEGASIAKTSWPPAAIVVTQLAVTLVVALGIVPLSFGVASIGADSASEFKNFGGDIDEGLWLGIAYAIAAGALVAVTGYLCLIPLPGGRYLLPGLGLALVIPVLGAGLLVVLWLIGIGGIGGPPAELPAAQEYGRVLHRTLPVLTIICVGAVMLGGVGLRHVRSPRWRRVVWWVPGSVAVVVSLALTVLIVVAHELPR
ncbi:hypothetical protein [Salinibacterium sp. ZJ450]|uniref:hypothetical protein n=1 Tax=Salinibacterium sp. ZJ450 TaxID=2708338 RepID=UPI00142362CA|nr:hypothetical protein [Salinibacterium sp. ZJ450]